MSSDDEKYDAPYLSYKNPDVSGEQPINENENILSTDGKKRKATSIQQFSRKRLRNPDQWERNMKKQAASSGQEYTSATTRKVIPARSVQKTCGPSC